MTSKPLSAVLALILAAASFGAAGPEARLPCSVRPKKGTSKTELPSMAKVSQADAQRAAIASVKSDKAEVTEAELEIEHGCLVYSFDIKIPDKSGVQEVMVDAGDGKVLSSKHESPKDEAREKTKDKASKKD